MKKKKKVIVLSKGISPKKIAANMSCCKTGPSRFSTEDE